MEKNYLRKIDKKMIKIIKIVGQEADKHLLSAYIVGGVVRDIILGCQVLDLDIVIEKDAILFAKRIAKAMKGELKTHKEFKTATLYLRDGLSVDFATARREKYVFPGALPRVMPGKLREDLFRRDFTINTCGISINKKSFGSLIDEFGGLEDIKNKKIRVLHDESFVDDPTRILRAIRFEKRFGFKIEKNTLQLIKDALKKKLYKNVSFNRYFNEFKKILKEEDVLAPIKRINNLKAFGFIDEKIKVLDLKLFNKIAKSTKKLRKLKDQTSEKDLMNIYLLALLDIGGEGLVSRLAKSSALAKEEKTVLNELKGLSKVEKELNGKDLEPGKIYSLLSRLSGVSAKYLLLKTNSAKVEGNIIRYYLKYKDVKLFINGKDVKLIAGLSGPEVGAVLNKVFAFKLNSKKKIRKQDEIKLVKALAFKG